MEKQVWRALTEVALSELGVLSPSAGDLGGAVPLGKFVGSKEHLDWLKIDLNAVEINIVQDYICTKNEYKYSS